MKIYVVTLEKYDEDFNGHVMSVEEMRYVATQEKAKEYFEDFKAKIREVYPPEDGFEPYTVDTNDYYTVRDDRCPRDWGEAASINIIEVEE